MINGENAAYKAPKFKDPHIRARQGLVENLVETYSNAQALKTAQQSKSFFFFFFFFSFFKIIFFKKIFFF